MGQYSNLSCLASSVSLSHIPQKLPPLSRIKSESYILIKKYCGSSSIHVYFLIMAIQRYNDNSCIMSASLYIFSLSLSLYIYIYIYIYMCVGGCVGVWLTVDLELVTYIWKDHNRKKKHFFIYSFNTGLFLYTLCYTCWLDSRQLCPPPLVSSRTFASVLTFRLSILHVKSISVLVLWHCQLV